MSKMIGFKVTEEQDKFLKKEAADNGMTKSEYVKARLFEDKFDDAKIKSQSLSEFEKNLISCAKKAVNFSYLAASKVASSEELKEAEESANMLLLKKGYKNKSNANDQE